MAPKLDKLERRTQKAIAELIRERLKEEDLANAVTAGALAEERMAQDDEWDKKHSPTKQTWERLSLDILMYAFYQYET